MTYCVLSTYVNRIGRSVRKLLRIKDVLRFIQSRFGELKVSEERYGDLLSEADSWYGRLMRVLSEGLEDVKVLENILTGRGGEV